MATKTKMHCSMDSKFVEIDWKIKGNNELTLLKMNQIEKDIKGLSDMMQWFIDSADKKYASKLEHEQNKEKIDKIDDTLKRLNRLVLWIIITAILATVILTKINYG